MNADLPRFERLLRDALTALSLPPTEQCRVTEPGCVGCELVEDFAHAYHCVTDGGSPHLNRKQKAVLADLDATIRQLTDADCVCFDPTILSRPVWNDIRKLARVALLSFDWIDHTIQPYTETEEGVWRRGENILVTEAEDRSRPDADL